MGALTFCKVCSEPFPLARPRSHANLISAEPAQLTQDHRQLGLSGPECIPDVQLMQSNRNDSRWRILN